MLHNLVKLFQNERECCFLLLPSVMYVRILQIVLLFIVLYVTRLGSRVKLYDALNTDVLKL